MPLPVATHDALAPQPCYAFASRSAFGLSAAPRECVSRCCLLDPLEPVAVATEGLQRACRHADAIRRNFIHGDRSFTAGCLHSQNQPEGAFLLGHMVRLWLSIWCLSGTTPRRTQTPSRHTQAPSEPPAGAGAQKAKRCAGEALLCSPQ